MQTLNVFQPGTTVLVGASAIEATVLSVMISAGAVQYEIVWWEGRKRTKEWLAAAEVRNPFNSSATGKTMQIGFMVPQPEEPAVRKASRRV